MNVTVGFEKVLVFQLNEPHRYIHSQSQMNYHSPEEIKVSS